MQKFTEVDRIDAKKRDVVARVKDFDEIYEVFADNKASSSLIDVSNVETHIVTISVLCITSFLNG